MHPENYPSAIAGDLARAPIPYSPTRAAGGSPATSRPHDRRDPPPRGRSAAPTPPGRHPPHLLKRAEPPAAQPWRRAARTRPRPAARDGVLSVTFRDLLRGWDRIAEIAPEMQARREVDQASSGGLRRSIRADRLIS